MKKFTAAVLIFCAGSGLSGKAFAEATTWEFSGGTLGTVTISPSTSTTAFSLQTGLGVYLRSGIQFTLRPSVAYVMDPVTTTVVWGVLGGPTINFTFADDYKDAMFLFLGIGINSVNVTVAGVTTTTLTVPYSVELGKRFSFGNMAYVPGVQINGSTSTAPSIGIVPLRFSFLL